MNTPTSSRQLDATDAPANDARAHQPYSNVRQLRLLARRKVNFPAFLKQGDRAIAVTIRNISTGGAGISQPAAVAVGATVSLHLLDGRTLDATLQWTRMGFAGLAFDSALKADDPLLENASSDEQGRARPANSPPLVAKVLSFAAAVKSTLHDRHKRTRDHVMLEAACRKQGFAWLIDEPEDRPKLPE